MRHGLRRIVVGVVLTCVLAVVVPGVWLLAQAPAGGTVAFVGARVFDGTGRPAVQGATLLVRDGRVAAVGPDVAIPAGATRVDVAGKTIVPGLINTHGHVNPDPSGGRAAIDAQLRLYAQYGITTVFSLGGDDASSLVVRDAQRAGAVNGARLYVAGPVITADTPAAARAEVNRVADMGVDLIKIRVDDNLGTTPKMTPEVYAAVIDQAHARDKRVAAHLFYLEDAEGLLAAGVDQLAHSVRDRDIDATLVAEMRRRSVCLTPTLTREVSTFVYESTPAFFSDAFFLRHADRAAVAERSAPAFQAEVRGSAAARAYKAGLEVASRNVKAIVDGGARVAMGTDTGPAGRFQGYFEHMELDLMVDAGLTPAQALVAATGDAARCMDVEGEIGTLAPGAWADFLILAQDPTTDLVNLRTIEQVWIAGRRLPDAP